MVVGARLVSFFFVRKELLLDSMKLSLPSVSVIAPAAELAQSVEKASHGILLLTDLPEAPFQTIRDLLKQSASYADRLNKAYPKNLVYKDSYASGKGGPTVDRKRVLDLSPERLAEIQAVEPELVQREGALAKALGFWESLQDTATRAVLPALAQATGGDEILQDVAFNYRMVDYYEDKLSVAPRCGEHRDFGSFTLIFSTQPGLQVFADNEWQDLPAIPSGSAFLLFGWCTQIRSNGRIPAALHRVVDDFSGERTSAVLFCAPKRVETSLEPVVRPGEERMYIGGIKVGQLRGKMARKWRFREGTVSEEDRVLEEEEIRVTNMKTQDDVVEHTVKV